ncbi:MAG: hypothetical protein WBC91_18260 [Phototrophicaceae bacterium]
MIRVSVQLKRSWYHVAIAKRYSHLAGAVTATTNTSNGFIGTVGCQISRIAEAGSGE